MSQCGRRECCAWEEKHSVCAGGHTGAKALVETAEVIGKAGGPDRFIGSTCEVAIFQSLACDFVDDGVGFTSASIQDESFRLY